jgi:subtilisin family serine protease
LRSNFIAALVGAVLTLYAQVSAAPFALPNLAGAAASPYMPGEVLVKFKPAAVAQERSATVAAQGHTVLAHLEEPGWMQVRLGAGETLETALTAYGNNPNVEYVQPNYLYHAALAPNDPQYSQLWAFKNTGQTITTGTYTPTFGTAGDDMNIEAAWGRITDCSGVVVAVVDSGVNYNQEDLAANMWNGGVSIPNHGWNYVNNNSDPMDLNGHGSHVAGIIGAVGNNARGTTGVCWKARIMAVRVLNAMNSGTTANVIQGINFAVTNGAKVINMSLGGGGAFDQAFSDAITTAQNSDVVVVVAAGNETNNNDAAGAARYPCNFTQPNLLCVAALDQNYALANFSNWGATSVHVGAPGTNILSSWAGTSASIADPLTSGWTFTPTTGGWAFGSVLVGGTPTPSLLDPPNYPNPPNYNTNTDDRARKAFNLVGVNVAVLQALAGINVVNLDHFRTGYSSAGGDPFAVGGTIIDDTTNLATYPFFSSGAFDISGCVSATCSIGFQLQSGPTTPKDRGLAIAGFRIQTLTLNATSYNTIDGTSMASPEVAGLAAMLRAYNPQYTYADTVNAIKNGGRPVPALAGKTTTGKAVDVMSSLAYLNPPTGLRATVQ